MSNLGRRLECLFRHWLPKALPAHTVHLHTWNFRSRALHQQVRVDLYLPAAFFRSETTALPVLYLNDGQDMEAVQLKPTLERLYQAGELPPLIVAAFYPKHRMQEYGTIRRPDYKGRGAAAAAYAQFLLQEFIPVFQRQYPVSRAAAHQAIAGFSLGGLSAFDLAWNHPEQFSKAGIFSGALWWRSTDFDPKNPDADRIVHEQVLQDGHVGPLQFWFQTGTHDETSDRNNNGVIDAIDDTLDLMKALQKVGYPKTAMHYVEVEKGIHHPSTWAKVMPDFLKWAFN